MMNFARPKRLRSTFTIGFALAALFTLMAVGTGYAATSDALAHRIGIKPDGWVATASVSADAAVRAIDADDDTLWMANMGNGDYFAVDLGKVHKLNRLEWLTGSVTGSNRNDFPTSFKVEVSLDGETWTTVADSSNPSRYKAENGLLQVIWQPTDARYVRVVQTGNTQTVRLSELLLWEEGMEVGVVIQYFDYFPKNVLVAEGTTVNWLQLDDAPHTVTAGAPFGPPEERAFDSAREAEGFFDMMFAGDTFAHTFNVLGEFLYHCIPHPGMQAYVTVARL